MTHLKNIMERAKQNDYFRQVLATGKNVQVVIMSIPPGGEIGIETHPDNDQTLMLVEGAGRVILDGQAADFESGDIVLVPAGTEHNFIARGDAPMKIITTYSPPHHPDGTVHRTKAEADVASAKKKNTAIAAAATTAATFQAL
jgi:mannose-6-phosphate isomerase-like protein (cupin superfamily)